ncbi:unnamed protein product [Phaeothamnion confervicola]
MAIPPVLLIVPGALAASSVRSWSLTAVAVLFTALFALAALLVSRRCPAFVRRRGIWDPLDDKCALIRRSNLDILRNAVERRGQGLKTMIILGSGGHTSEMLRLTAHLDPKVYTPVLYVVANTDHTSAARIPWQSDDPPTVVTIPRSREVLQSWLSTVPSTLRAAVHSWRLFRKHKPDLILANGPGTCIPLCIMAVAWRVSSAFFGHSYSSIIFCESFCRSVLTKDVVHSFFFGARHSTCSPCRCNGEFCVLAGPFFKPV